MDWSRRGDTRRELKQWGRGIKVRVDKSIGIVNLIVEILVTSRLTESLRLIKRVIRKKRNLFIMNQESESYRQDLYTSVGTMKY